LPVLIECSDRLKIIMIKKQADVEDKRMIKINFLILPPKYIILVWRSFLITISGDDYRSVAK